MKKKVYGVTIAFALLFSAVAGAVEVPSATENTWATKEPMPQTHGGLRAAVVNGKIYAIGNEVNYEYDPAADNWTARKPMPTPRDYFGIAVYQNKIYCIGGRWWDPAKEGELSSNANEVYDPLTDTWETREPMPTNRSNLKANAVDGKIYLIGGRTGGQKTTVALNEVYNPATDSWTTKEPMPYPVVGYASAVVNGKIHVIGGQNEFHAPDDPLNTDHNQIYDPLTDTWSLGAALPSVVWNAAAGATTGAKAPKRIYVVGGTPDRSMGGTDITQVYDPANNVWSFGAYMPTARAWLAVAVVDDLLYAIGGSPGLMLSFLTANEQYTPIGYHKPEPPPSPSPAPPPSPSPTPSQKPTSTPEQQQPEPFPTTLVASISTLMIAGVIAGFLYRHNKRNEAKTEQSEAAQSSSTMTT
jgi:N-acetylneuraminic acid mutarotase